LPRGSACLAGAMVPDDVMAVMVMMQQVPERTRERSEDSTRAQFKLCAGGFRRERNDSKHTQREDYPPRHRFALPHGRAKGTRPLSQAITDQSL
ncbi:MAG TPA: hypothetical protein VFX37_11190, partial [Pseudolabrys sp.]|nr:hypothetical protein [Pseudolabrys sp.]